MPTWAAARFFLAFSAGLKAMVGAALASEVDYTWLDRPPHNIDLHFSEEQTEIFRSADPELLRLTPVVDSLHDAWGAADSPGYSVGHTDGKAMFIAYYWRAYHFGGVGPDHPAGLGSKCAIVRSLDGGLTWSKPYRADLAMDSFDTDRSQIGWGLAALSMEDHFLVASKRGIFRTWDHGESWERLESAWSRQDLPNLPRPNSKFMTGPNLIDHPVGGLMIFAHIHRIEATAGRFFILHSLDEGETWDWTEVETDNLEVTPVEPSAVMYGPGDRIFMITRNGPNGQDANPGTLFIDVKAPGDYEISHAGVTNCRVDGHQDTHDIIYNPRTDAFEAVVTNRGTPESHYNIMELTLYTLSREEAEAGSHRWNYRGHLVNPIQHADTEAEGSHPGGGFVHGDYHYIPFHRGDHHSTRASGYLLRRSLDTDAVSDLLKHYESYATE